MNVDAVAVAIYRADAPWVQPATWDITPATTERYRRMAAAAIAALNLTEEVRREEGDDPLWADEHRLVSPWVRDEQLCADCGCPKARCDGYRYGSKCCPDCKHRSSLREEQP